MAEYRGLYLGQGTDTSPSILFLNLKSGWSSYKETIAQILHMGQGTDTSPSILFLNLNLASVP